MEIFETEVDKYESMLEDYSQIFHKNHFQVSDIKNIPPLFNNSKT